MRDLTEASLRIICVFTKRNIVMKEWIKLSALLCVFGFLKEIRPSDPFMFEFLAGPWRNLTADQVVQDVLPVGTYSHLSHLVVIFLITDLSRYKPLIIVSGAAGTVVWALFLWTKSLSGLNVAMVRDQTLQHLIQIKYQFQTLLLFIISCITH